MPIDYCKGYMRISKSRQAFKRSIDMASREDKDVEIFFIIFAGFYDYNLIFFRFGALFIYFYFFPNHCLKYD